MAKANAAVEEQYLRDPAGLESEQWVINAFINMLVGSKVIDTHRHNYVPVRYPSTPQLLISLPGARDLPHNIYAVFVGGDIGERDFYIATSMRTALMLDEKAEIKFDRIGKPGRDLQKAVNYRFNLGKTGLVSADEV